MPTRPSWIEGLPACEKVSNDLKYIAKHKGPIYMDIGERFLRFLSRAPYSDEYFAHNDETTLDNALNLLTRVYPNFSDLVSGKYILDFGCGTGYQSIALVMNHNCSVVGVDSNISTLRKAMEHAKNQNVSSQKITFVEKISQDMLNNFDVVISQNSFEHFTDPEKVLDEMGSLLSNSGIILLTFGPPWLAPYGSHMQFFCKVPWINVIFPEELVMKVRNHFRNDGAKRYEEVESGLNRMTIAKFESIISASSFNVVYRKYECVKQINWLSNVPVLREFFINHVTVILAKSA